MLTVTIRSFINVIENTEVDGKMIIRDGWTKTENIKNFK